MVILGVVTHKSLKGIALGLALGVEVGLEALWCLFTEERNRGKMAGSLILYHTTEVSANRVVVGLGRLKLRACLCDLDHCQKMDTGLYALPFSFASPFWERKSFFPLSCVYANVLAIATTGMNSLDSDAPAITSHVCAGADCSVPDCDANTLS